MTYSQILAETCPNRTEKRLKPSVIAQTRFQTVKFRPKLVRILEEKKDKNDICLENVNTRHRDQPKPFRGRKQIRRTGSLTKCGPNFSKSDRENDHRPPRPIPKLLNWVSEGKSSIFRYVSNSEGSESHRRTTMTRVIRRDGQAPLSSPQKSAHFLMDSSFLSLLFCVSLERECKAKSPALNSLLGQSLAMSFFSEFQKFAKFHLAIFKNR